MTSDSAAPLDPRRFDPLGDDFDAEAAATGNGIFGLPQDPDGSFVHLVPVPFEATVSYRDGTARGPAAIRDASGQIDLFDIDTGRPFESGIVMLPESDEIVALNREARAAAKTLMDAGGAGGSAMLAKELDVVNDAGAKLNDVVRATAAASLDKGHLVGLVGGDHSTPFGLITEVAARRPGLGILHFDAHHDLRESFEDFTWSHASIMHNVMTRLEGVAKLVQVGVRDFAESERRMVEASDRRIVCHDDREMSDAKFAGVPFDMVARAIVAELPMEVYVSFDVDGLDPTLCPNTGTPVPGGLCFNETVRILREVVASGRRIVGFDLVEVAPERGRGGESWDAIVGMRMLYKLIGFAVKSLG